MRKTILTFVVLAALSAHAQYRSQVWSPDNVCVSEPVAKTSI